MIALFRFVGRIVLNVLSALGAVATVLVRTVSSAPRMRGPEFLRALSIYGVGSLRLSFAIAALAGSTVVLQAGLYAEQFGARQYTGWAAGYAVLWEFGPLLLGLMMAARIGAQNAAELALLKVNGQMEGLRGVSLDPFVLLVAPRTAAAAVAITCLSTVTCVVAILFEALAAYLTLGLPVRVFFRAFEGLLGAGDLWGCVIKSLVFGLAVAVVSTVAGLRAEGGARGVGRATAAAVVASFGALYVIDLAITGPLSRWLS